MMALEGSEKTNAFFIALQNISEMRLKITCTQESPTHKHESMRSVLINLLNEYEEIGIEKLYQWLQSSIKRDFSDDDSEVIDLFSQAFSAILERKILWQSCIEELTFQRRSVLQRSFMDALIKGGNSNVNGINSPGNNGSSKPIKFHAYDHSFAKNS